MGTLFLVATPIGNLEDISARALRILREVRLIAAEDTRQTRKLLSHFEIHTALTSYHEQNKESKQKILLSELTQGDIALVSDAGTPALNDPGYELVRAVLAAGHQVSPIPGPSAPIAALVASGLPTDTFLYLGYLPRKTAERKRFLADVADLPYTLIVLETPHRLLSALRDLIDVFGDRQVAIARELTKLHEEMIRGKLSTVQDHFRQHPPRGEFTLVIAGNTLQPAKWNEDKIRTTIEEMLEASIPPAEIAGQLATKANWPRREVYRLVIQIQAD